jgi:hypothetical protein
MADQKYDTSLFAALGITCMVLAPIPIVSAALAFVVLSRTERDLDSPSAAWMTESDQNHTQGARVGAWIGLVVNVLSSLVALWYFWLR